MYVRPLLRAYWGFIQESTFGSFQSVHVRTREPKCRPASVTNRWNAAGLGLQLPACGVHCEADAGPGPVRVAMTPRPRARAPSTSPSYEVHPLAATLAQETCVRTTSTPRASTSFSARSRWEG